MKIRLFIENAASKYIALSDHEYSVQHCFQKNSSIFLDKSTNISLTQVVFTHLFHCSLHLPPRTNKCYSVSPLRESVVHSRTAGCASELQSSTVAIAALVLMMHYRVEFIR